MPVKVVDASAVAAWLFDEPEGDAIIARFLNATLVAPSLLDFEIANVCVKKIKREPEKREPILAAFGLLKELALDIVEIDHAEALRMALRFNLSAYDASYLWLAWNLGAELITLDQRLGEAAARVGK